MGSNPASSIPSATQTAREFMSPPICDSLFLAPVTANEIEVARPRTIFEYNFTSF